MSRIDAAASAGAGVIKSRNILRELKNHKHIDDVATSGTPFYAEAVFVDWCDEFDWHLSKVGIDGAF